MADVNKLVREFAEGRIGRRDFIFRAAALGISLTGIETLMAACGSFPCFWKQHHPFLCKLGIG